MGACVSTPQQTVDILQLRAPVASTEHACRSDVSDDGEDTMVHVRGLDEKHRAQSGCISITAAEHLGPSDKASMQMEILSQVRCLETRCVKLCHEHYCPAPVAPGAEQERMTHHDTRHGS